MFRVFFSTILFGLIIGLSSAVYLLGLDWIQHFHQSNTAYPYLLIVVFGLIFFVRKNTLYFPTSVHAVVDANEVEQRHWSKLSFLWNLLGSWMSHLAGASLGREGTTVVLASSLTQVCKLNWNYFKPIIFSATLASVFGQPLVALVIIIEMFKTNHEQKIYSLIMAWVAVLVLQSLNIHFLFSNIDVNLSNSFLDKIYVAIAIGAVVGLIARYYKQGYVLLTNYFSKHNLFAVAAVLILTLLLMWPETRVAHSLSLEAWSQIQLGSFTPQLAMQFILLKLFLTLAFTSLGFIGGDFVPTVIIGAAVGVVVASFFNVNYTFGFAMGFLAFFTAVSRLKWTSLWLIFLVAGFIPMLWAYLSLSLARYMSGSISLYRRI